MYAIGRLKQAKSAWQWRVTLRRRGKLYAKTFPDLKHGGTKKALAAARAWRDRRIAGVHFLKTRRQPLGYWHAKVKLPGGRKIHRSFSVRRFGERQAFRLAVAARAELLLRVENRPYLYDRTAKKFAALQRRGDES